jgi:hypothetical protein
VRDLDNVGQCRLFSECPAVIRHCVKADATSGAEPQSPQKRSCETLTLSWRDFTGREDYAVGSRLISGTASQSRQ